jgi:hypothetical protein
MKLARLLRSTDAWAIVFLAAWPLAFYWQVALGQKAFFGDDITSFFFPLRVELSRALVEGRLPLWTVYLESGFPIFAEGQIAALDPLNLILHTLLPVSIAFSYSILFRLAFASIGMFLFCRSAGLRASSAFLAAFVFGFSGFQLAHVQHLTLEAVAAWLPWLLYFQNQMQRAWRVGKRSAVLWFCLETLAVGIQFVSGHPQIAVVNLIPLGLISLVGVAFWNRPENAAARDRTRALLESLGVTALSVGVGVGIAAVQWLPSAELLNLSVRPQDAGPGFFSSYSMNPAMLTQFVSPFWQLGKPDVPNMEYWGYLGILPILLMLFAARRKDARTRFFFLLAIGALILALGNYLPVYDLLYYVPVFNRFRVPARFLLLFTFAVLLLAALGFDELQNRLSDSVKPNRWAFLAACPFALLVLGVIAAPDRFPGEFWMNLWAWLPWVLGSFAFVIVCLAWRRANRGLVVALGLGLTIVDLTLFAQPFAGSLNPLASPSELLSSVRPITAMDSSQMIYRMLTTIYNESLRPNRPLIDGKQSAQIYSPLALKNNEDYLFIISPAMLNLMNVRYYTKISYPQPADDALWGYSFALDLFHEQVNIPPTRAAQVEIVSYGDNIADLPDGFVAGQITLTAADGTVAIIPIRVGVDTADWAYEGLATTSGVKHSKPANSSSFPAFLPSVGNSFNGSKYLARQKLDIPIWVTSVSATSNLTAGELFIERLTLIDESGRGAPVAELAHKDELDLEFKSHAVALFENRDVMPRAFVVHQAQVVAGDQVLVQMRQSDFRPDQVVLLSDGKPLNQANSSPATMDQVSIADYQSDHVVIKTKTDQTGYLILADSYYPGWEAAMDGEPVPIYRADYVYRAVQVQPGEHTIVFEFHPFSFTLGAIVSGVSMMLLLVVTVLGYRKFGSRLPLGVHGY